MSVIISLLCIGFQSVFALLFSEVHVSLVRSKIIKEKKRLLVLSSDSNTGLSEPQQCAKKMVASL
jgi:hypothetical protein